MWLMWRSNLSLLSKMIPRLRTCDEGDRVQLLKVREKLWFALVWDEGSMMIMSDLSLFSCR